MDTQKTPFWQREGIQPLEEEPNQHVEPAKVPTPRINSEEARRMRLERELGKSQRERDAEIAAIELKALINVTTRQKKK